MNIEIDDEVRRKSLTIIYVYRAREVKQSYFTSIFTTVFSMIQAFLMLLKI